MYVEDYEDGKNNIKGIHVKFYIGIQNLTEYELEETWTNSNEYFRSRL